MIYLVALCIFNLLLPTFALYPTESIHIFWSFPLKLNKKCTALENKQCSNKHPRIYPIMNQGRNFFRIYNQDWGCRYEVCESLVYQLMANSSPKQLCQVPLPLIICESTMPLDPYQHIVFSDFVIFTKLMYVKRHSILTYISLTANVIEHLCNDLITVQIVFYVNFLFMFFIFLLDFLSFPYLFAGLPCMFRC